MTKYREWPCARALRALQPHTGDSLPTGRDATRTITPQARLAYEGCFLAGLKQLPIEGEAFRPFKGSLCDGLLQRPLQPTFVVDISPPIL